jgi:caffeoyl-CoA O-methyltransferase
MFHDIPQEIFERMKYLEDLDAKHREEDFPQSQRLRQIPPVTGRFLALLASLSPEGKYIEIGTSGGYSSLWIALACRFAGRKITTFEILDGKVKLARETFEKANVSDVVELVHGNALELLGEYKDIAFCFLDAEKENYPEFYDIIIPNLIKGGIFAADNAISHKEAIRPMLETTMSDERVDSVVVPVGKGVLVSRKL